MKWHFRRKRPDDTSREAIGGEFFSNDSLRDGFPQALIREGIQNSLDARSGGEPVHVRIFLSEEAGALSAKAVAPFAEGLFPHLEAPPNEGLEPPKPTDVCPFLVFEDFSTSGLEGDIRQWSHPQNGAKKNAFFAFLRAEGVSDKAAQESGRWGIGKFVFPRSSRARAFFALTVRKSDEPGRALLMGRAILHGHYIGDSEVVPDGYFGEVESVQGCDFILPSDSKDLTERFSVLFRLERSMLPGLSVVVPWYLTSEISARALAQATVREYFLPIMTGRLSVEIATPSTRLRLDHEGLEATIPSLGDVFASEIRPLLSLAQYSTDDSSDKVILNSHKENGGPKWLEELIPELLREKIKILLAAGKPVAVRVPITVRPKRKIPEVSHFDVYLIQTPGSTTDTNFVRGDITVPGQRSIRVNDHCALVVVRDRAIATLLGDAENPSHTQWNKDSEKFRTKYEYGPQYLSFVRQASRRILEIVYGSDSAADPQLLSDVFFKPGAATSGPDSARKPKPLPGKEPPDRPELPKQKPARLLIRECDAGFVISPGPQPPPPSASIEVRLAYDVPSGNPFSRFNPADFSLKGGEIHVDGGGGTAIEVLDDNTFRVVVKYPEFKVTAKGFDRNRDLIVKTRILERSDDDETV